MDVDFVLEHLVELAFYGASLQVEHGTGVLLAGTVDAGIGLQVCLYRHHGAPVDDRVGSV